METLKTNLSNNIGQVPENEAASEIVRLNKQTGKEWRIDKSPLIFVGDESDEDVKNPCTLFPNHVWITCEPLIAL